MAEIEYWTLIIMSIAYIGFGFYVRWWVNGLGGDDE